MSSGPFNEANLIRRLAKSLRPVMFVVGSPLTSPVPPQTRGVPAVAGMIEMVRQRLALGDDFQVRGSPAECYEQAMTLWRANRGNPSPLIREAVLEARVERDPDNLRSQAIAGDRSTCEKLELQKESWFLSPGVEFLGKLIAGAPEQFSPVVLTSNFDPLIEVSIRSAGGHAITLALDHDVSPDLAKSPGQTQVIHFHGFWYGSQTLHTPQQLVQERPQVRDSIAAYLREYTCVVVAYGGWSDIFVDALSSALSNHSIEPDIIWACHSDSEPDHGRAGGVLKSLQKLSETQHSVTFYYGIDVHRLMSGLWEQLGRPRPRHLLKVPSPQDFVAAPRQPTSGVLLEEGARTSPHALETLWGVDRGLFLGLLGGLSEDDGFSSLAHTEGWLWEAASEHPNQPTWPIRWWIRLDPTRCPEGPQRIEDIWRCGLDSTDPRIRCLSTGSSPKQVVPGYFLEMPVVGKTFAQLQLLRLWVNTLNGFNRMPPASVVAHWTTIARDDLVAMSERLRSEMSIPVDGFWLQESGDAGPAQLRSVSITPDEEAVAIIRGWIAGQKKTPIPEDKRVLLSPEMRAVAAYAEGSIPEAEFIRSNGIRAFAQALRAGLDFPSAISHACNMPLSSDCWWLATHLRPTRQRLKQIVKLAAVHRAMWGLCSAEEWNAFASHVKAEITSSRQGRRFLPTILMEEKKSC